MLEAVGEGSMGMVYAAQDPDLNRKVAIKLLRRELCSGPKAASLRERLAREARALARLSDPNVVAVYDTGAFGQQVFIAMEFVEGGTLSRWLRQKPRALQEVVSVLMRAGRGLEAAHEAGLVHRDFKPDNVLVGDDGRVRVTDFGLARAGVQGSRSAIPDLAPGSAVADASNTYLTATGALVGTPAYMAPEQHRGEVADARADIFSFCVALYEAVYGARPFEARTISEQQDVIKSGRLLPPPPGTEVPMALRRIIVRGLSYRPEDRPASMRELLNALERAAAPKRWRHPLAAAMIALARAAALAGSSSLRSPADRAPEQGPSHAVASEAHSRRISANDEAQAEYEQARSLERQGSLPAARRRLARVIELDPSVAAAHLRLALSLFWKGIYPTEARAAFKDATDRRALLDERDQLLLDAMAPYVAWQPSNLDETRRRIARAAARLPDDAEIALHYANVLVDQGEWSEAIALFDAALARDPGEMRLWSRRGYALAYAGQPAQAIDSLNECLRLYPDAMGCNIVLWEVLEYEGQCERMTEVARQMVAQDPMGARPYRDLAASLAALGRPREAVSELLAQMGARVPERSRYVEEAMQLFNLDIAEGNASSGERRLLDLEAQRTSEPNDMVRLEWQHWLLDLYSELGKIDEAAKLADTLLKRRDAWVHTPRVEDATIVRDYSAVAWHALFRAGKISRAAYAAQRDAWLCDWEARVAPYYRGYLWLQAYGLTVMTEEEAREALEVLPRFSPLPPFGPREAARGDTGRVYLLAGRVEEALPLLEKEATMCIVLEHPIQHLRSFYWLGRAYEAKGQRARACEAYNSMLGRWGGPSTPFRTAISAKGRASALHCPSPALVP